MKLYVEQDGATFYVYNRDPAEVSELEALSPDITTYPGKVKDFDVTAARHARIWFESLHKFRNELVWIYASIAIESRHE